jgi:multicomponent Na+:H+ antiporter subunit B
MPLYFVFDLILLLLLVVVALAIVRVKDLFAAVTLTGIYGLLSASFFVLMDAVDVAFTEAAVGAGVFPLLMLAVLAYVGRFESSERKVRFFPLLLALFTLATLFAVVPQIPAFGSADAPAHQHVAARYIEQSPEEIGIPNMVTSILASYRGFDTLGEVLVILTAAVGVMVLLIGTRRRVQPQEHPADDDMADHKVLRIVGKMLIPLILIFSLYVQFHGEYGPGGGFQAGVIFAAAIILYAMLFGLNNAQQVIPLHIVRVLTALGVLLYGSVGVAGLLAGGNFLDYSVLASNPVVGQHVGIILIELGVGITVAASMILIFFSFSLATRANGDQRS